VLCAVAAVAAARGADVQEAVTYVDFDETPVCNLTEWKMALGDNPEWAEPLFDDSDWERNEGEGLWINEGRPGKGVRWYRKTLFFPEELPELSTLALYQIAAVSASEIYWDGQLVAANGEVGASREQEVPGNSGQIIPVHKSLTRAGRHVVAMRMSNYHNFSGLIWPALRLGYFNELQQRLFRNGAIAIFLAGIFVVTALFHIAILLGRANKWTYALFSAFCLSCTAYIIVQSMLYYFQVNLGIYYTLAALNDIPWFFMMSLLPVFFLYEFSTPHRKWFAVAIAGITLSIVMLARLATFGLLPVAWLEPLDRINRIHSISTVFISICVSAWAIRARKVGSATITIGLVIFLIGAYVSYRTQAEHGWAIGFAFLILVITISLSRQMARRDRQLQEIRFRSARLELELLKRQIQPHFLLNSLNSIVAWLEEEPRTAAKLVNALADELRMLLSFSGRKTISLRKELQLCEAHLAVMSLRHEKQYTLSSEGIDSGQRLPPLIIHTLVENGVTHGYKRKNAGVFRFRCEQGAKLVRFILFNDSAVDNPEAGYTEGTGFRYVRTRLEEVYPGRWTMLSGVVENGWQTVIELEKESA
jgi:hypothetical protein